MLCLRHQVLEETVFLSRCGTRFDSTETDEEEWYEEFDEECEWDEEEGW